MKSSTERARGAPTKHGRRLGVAIAVVAVLMGGLGFGTASQASAASPAGLPCGHRVEAREGAWVRENPDMDSVKLKWKAWHDFIWWDCDWSQVLDRETGVWFQPVRCECASDDVGWMPASAFD